MKVRWASPARDDLRHHIRHIAADSPTAAHDVATRIHMAVNGLAIYPLIGRPGRVVDTRELVIPRTSIILAYRVVGEVAEIVGAVNHAQQWPEEF